jgi:hypothetical protein
MSKFRIIEEHLIPGRGNMGLVIDKKWKDESGNIKPNSWDTCSENPSTWNNGVAIMRDKLGLHNPNVFDIAQLNANKHLTNGGRYITNDYDIEKVEAWNEKYGLGHRLANALKLSHTLGLERSPDRFSHDETNGVASGSNYFLRVSPTKGQERARHLNNLEIIEDYTSQTWYRAYDCGAGVRYAKRPYDNRNLICQIEFFATKAFNSTDKDSRGCYHASGKYQAWLRVVGLGLDLEKCTKDMPEEGGLVEMFSNFIPEHDHPLNVMARGLYS